MERLRKILANVLLAFAIISIGFILGKYSVKSGQEDEKLAGGKGYQVVVYYLHSTFRCVTCNTIEKMTRELLDSSYSKQLAGGRIQLVEENFQENEILAKQFNVVASCVVVAKKKDGVVVDYKRLDEVWTKMKNPESFNQYIGEAIDGYLEKNQGEL